MRITRRLPAAIAAALALSTWAVSGQAPPADTGAAACGATLPLVWIDERRLPPAVLAAAEEETGRIWADAGIAIAWARPGGGRGIQPGDVLVVLRTTLPKAANASVPHPQRRVLGRVIRESESRPGRLIEIAVPALLASLDGQSMFQRPLAQLPSGVQDRATGRALGRVIAHEIGHWLFGRAHAPDGLMKPSIGRTDLVAAYAPPLPREWPAIARARLRAHRPCPS